MVGERLRQLLLEAAAGPVDGGVPGRATHPVCGDEVVLHVRAEGGRAVSIGWQARACPAATATAALAAQVLVGSDAATAQAVLRRALAAHGGLAAHERHAEGLVLRAFAAALGAGA
jgi:NifU-like protein involved in Fe-S cluster formation